MVNPITPNEVKKTIPDEVIKAFNELIAFRWDGERSVVSQKEVADLIVEYSGLDREMIFKGKLLDVEQIYIEVGWHVEYHKPGFNENQFEPYFVFRKE